MSFMDDVRVRGRRADAGESYYYDEGLRKYMVGVYNYMASALGVSGLCAFIVSSIPSLLHMVYSTPLGWLVAFLPIAIAIGMSAKINTMSTRAAHACFWGFSAAMGVSLSYIFVLYTGDSIARVFLISASIFAATSLYGYTTRRDLSSMGSFLFMGLIGLISASVVNIFMRSSALMFATSLVGVVIFIGLTAYDMQKIKSIYFSEAGSAGPDAIQKISIMGALSLYMDFINLFTSLLHLMGNRRQ